MKLYFVRHGRTMGMGGGRIQGANGDSALESSVQQSSLGPAWSQTYFDAALFK